MDKIKALLENIGASPELANKICEHLEHYSNDLKEQYERQLQEKVEKAKRICIEEVAKEKVNLARKVAVFLESKVKSVEHAMTKQRVAEETEATARLKKAKALLEDIEIEGGVPSREIRALELKSERLDKLARQLREERQRAVESANRANAIAVKVLKKNQLMESTLKKHGLMEDKGGAAKCECGSPVMGEGSTCKSCECKKCGKKPCKCESKKKGKALHESKKKGKTLSERLDKSRRAPAKSKSTRRPLVESEIPAGTYKGGGSPDITKIASEMPE